MKMYLMAASV